MMIQNEEALFDQLDQYIKGTLANDARLLLEELMNNDASFRQKVNDHVKFITALNQYGDREALKISLETYHRDLKNEQQQTSLSNSPILGIRRYWPMLAVAASVALISIVGTLISIQFVEEKQNDDYKELRRNVEQIKKSQSAILADMREVKEKEDPLPGNYAGTGFLISADGYVATSYHVIRDADSVYLQNKKFGRLKATIVKADRINDIAILKIEQTSFKASLPYNIRADEADLGEDVFTLGFPREEIVYGEGTISSSTGYRSNPHTYQIAVPVNPGNSGGPLLNKQGQLVGIISGIQTGTLGAAFAIKSSVLLDVIASSSGDSLAVLAHLPKQNKLKSLSRVEQIKRLQDFVFVMKVYNSK